MMRSTHRLPCASLAVLLALLLTPGISAQVSSGSDGSDGALTFAPDAGVLVFDPEALGLDVDDDNVFHFTTITVPSGTTVRLSANELGEGKPVRFLATGDVTIDGTLDLDGERGGNFDEPRFAAIAGAGGYHGGMRGGSGQPGRFGGGPGGGAPTLAAGHLIAAAGQTVHGRSYGSETLLPLIGGSGGGGGDSAPITSGGGAGGGAILVASSSSIRVGPGGGISARGGNRGALTTGNGSSGAGGSGGAIRLLAPSVVVEGTLDVSGGTGGIGGGSPGRVRIEALRRTLLGDVAPPISLSTASPGPIFLPAEAARVRVTRIASVDAPLDPRAEPVPADIEISESGAVTIELAGAGVPVGTVIRLRIIPETGDAVIVESTPLVGSLAASTASAGPIAFPFGLSRVTVAATWDLPNAP